MSSENGALVGAPSAPTRPARTWSATLLGTSVAAVLRLRDATWAKDVGEIAKIDGLLAAGEKVLAVFWHGNYVPLFSLLAGRSACVFARDSFRGRVIAEVCRRFGYESVLLPDGGGRRARGLMRDGLTGHRAAAIAVDGPAGPHRAVKSGAIEVASALGFLLVPVSVAASRSYVHARRWDRMETPRLFSRVHLAVGDPIRVAPMMDEAGVAAARGVLGNALDAVTLRAKVAAGAGV